MLSIFKFYFLSSNREIYRAIAREHDTSAIHVYRLAHGRRGKCDKDYYIIKKLRDKGLITYIFHK